MVRYTYFYKMFYKGHVLHNSHALVMHLRQSFQFWTAKDWSNYIVTLQTTNWKNLDSFQKSQCNGVNFIKLIFNYLFRHLAIQKFCPLWHQELCVWSWSEQSRSNNRDNYRNSPIFFSRNTFFWIFPDDFIHRTDNNFPRWYICLSNRYHF